LGQHQQPVPHPRQPDDHQLAVAGWPGTNGNWATQYGRSSVRGNFSYTGNAGRLYITGSPTDPVAGTDVAGNFTFNTNTNTGDYDIGGLAASGHSYIS
jgi:hypothetical protein